MTAPTRRDPSGRLSLAWGVLGAYVLVVILHTAFATTSGIVGYVVVSAVGLIPLVWLWRRADSLDVRRRIS
jgi:hypothetical protein